MTLTSKIRKNKEISELRDILFKSPVLLFFHLNTLEGIDWLSFKKDLNAFTLTYNVPQTLKKPFANTIDTHCETGLNSQRCAQRCAQRCFESCTTTTTTCIVNNTSSINSCCACCATSLRARQDNVLLRSVSLLRQRCSNEVRQVVGTPLRCAHAAPLRCALDREPHTARIVLKTKVVKNTLLNVLLSQNSGFKGFKGPTLVVYCAPKAIVAQQSFAEHTLYNISALQSFAAQRANEFCCAASTSSYSVDNNILLHACTGIIQQFLQSISVVGTPHFKHALTQSNISNCSKSVENAVQQYVALQNTNGLHSSAVLLAQHAQHARNEVAQLAKIVSDQSNDVGRGDAKLIPLGLFFTQYNKYVPISAPNFESFDYEAVAAPDTTKRRVSAGESQAYATAYLRSVANTRYNYLTAEQPKQQDHNTIDYKYELARVYDISKFPTIYYQMQLVLPPSLLCVPQQHLIKSLISNLQALSIIGNPMRKLLQILSLYQKIM